MNQYFKRAAGITAALAVAGCASVAVTNDAIERNTATALGIAPGTFAISNRVDEGVKTSYAVRTNAGKQFACYVTGTVSVVGRVVSDAVCQPVASPTPGANAAAPAAPAAPTCNALLKAAGKC